MNYREKLIPCCGLNALEYECNCDEIKKLEKQIREDAKNENINRERFETWARVQGFHTSKAIHRDYENSKLNWMWKAWQEARRNS